MARDKFEMMEGVNEKYDYKKESTTGHRMVLIGNSGLFCSRKFEVYLRLREVIEPDRSGYIS
jgi:hypothetical protein